MKAHCLFEQSGTFKNEFKKLGIDAYDYDLRNDFGETDHVIDLFAEIEGGVQGMESIFDGIMPEDIILAFFPCTYFQENNALFLSGQSITMKGWTMAQKMEQCIDRHKSIHEFYTVLCELVLLSERRGLRLIVENPATQTHRRRLLSQANAVLVLRI